MFIQLHIAFRDPEIAVQLKATRTDPILETKLLKTLWYEASFLSPQVFSGNECTADAIFLQISHFSAQYQVRSFCPWKQSYHNLLLWFSQVLPNIQSFSTSWAHGRAQRGKCTMQNLQSTLGIFTALFLDRGSKVSKYQKPLRSDPVLETSPDPIQGCSECFESIGSFKKNKNVLWLVQSKGYKFSTDKHQCPNVCVQVILLETACYNLLQQFSQVWTIPTCAHNLLPGKWQGSDGIELCGERIIQTLKNLSQNQFHLIFCSLHRT